MSLHEAKVGRSTDRTARLETSEFVAMPLGMIPDIREHRLMRSLSHLHASLLAATRTFFGTLDIMWLGTGCHARP